MYKLYALLQCSSILFTSVVIVDDITVAGRAYATMWSCNWLQLFCSWM